MGEAELKVKRLKVKGKRRKTKVDHNNFPPGRGPSIKK
jgi:hypothetical protein